MHLLRPFKPKTTERVCSGDGSCWADGSNDSPLAGHLKMQINIQTELRTETDNITVTLPEVEGKVFIAKDRIYLVT